MMEKTTFLFLLLLIVVAYAQDEFGSLFSRFEDGREEFLSGNIKFIDLGVFSSDPLTNVNARGKVRPGQTIRYKVRFTSDVTEARVGVQFWDYIDENGGNVVLEVNMDNKKKPFLNGDNINTDTQCRGEKIYEGKDDVVCSFDTSSKGEGTLYIWVTGKKFTTYELYAVQRKD